MVSPLKEKSTDPYFSVRFVGCILLFSVVHASVQAFLEFFRTSQLSMLSMISNFISGALLGAVLGLVFMQLPFKRTVRIALAWLVLFIVQEFSNLVEGYFFTTFLPTVTLFLAASVVALGLTLIEALLAGILFTPPRPFRSFNVEVRAYFGRKSSSSWISRSTAASLVYFPIYFLFGALISPIVLPYYQNSSLGLTIPSFTVMVPLEFARGFLYVIALLPIIATLRVARWHLFLALASLLYVAGAVVPFLVAGALPVQLKIVHGLEILADCLVYGAALVYLLGPEK